MSAVHGRWVLVTGAGSGIGLEAARAFARRGAKLVISDIDAAALEQARAGLAGTGATCLARHCDIADPASVARLAAEVQQAVGAIDVLVNNAGIAYMGRFEDTPVAQWRRILEVNVIGMVQVTQAFMPAMRAAGGPRKIVNVASAAGFSPLPSLSAYAASKHAVVGLSEVLAQELDGSALSVLVVCPGIVNTAIVHVSAAAPGITQAELEKIQRHYATKGCHPRVVAEDLVRAVERDSAFLFTGPSAKLGHWLMRFSRRLTRRLTLMDARTSGYLIPRKDPAR